MIDNILEFFSHRKTLSKDVKYILRICIIVILLFVFWPFNCKTFSVENTKLWDVIEKISLAFITSFIFYYINVHIKNQREKKHINTYLFTYLFPLNIQSSIIINSIIKRSKTYNDDIPDFNSLSKQEIYSIWENYFQVKDNEVDFSIEANKEKLKYILDWFAVNNINFEKIFKIIHVIDIKLINILNSIQANDLQENINSLYILGNFEVYLSNNQFQNTYIELLTRSLHLLISNLNELQEYIDSEMKLRR